jgi:hypothetical protein
MTSHLAHGPRPEQIDGGDPTFRVEVEFAPDDRDTYPTTRPLRAHEALMLARCVHAWLTDGIGLSVRAVHVVDERTGFTRDTIPRIGDTHA